MRIWTVANQKGGVGKTTTVVALASLLADRGQRVLMLDLDPQGSLSSYFRHDPETLEHSSFDLFQAFTDMEAETVRRTLREAPAENLMLLPANTSLATLERKAVSQAGMGLAVSRALTLLWDEFDYVLIDSPPTLGVLLINALAACERILVPVQTEHMAIKGLERMLNTLDMMSRSRGRPLHYTLVPTLFDRRTQAGVSSLRQLRKQYEDCIWHSAIPVDTRLRDASARGITPLDLDRNSRGARAYAALLKTLLGKPVAPAQKEAAHG